MIFITVNVYIVLQKELRTCNRSRWYDDFSYMNEFGNAVSREIHVSFVAVLTNIA